MVAVARALIGMPKLLILDEPSLGLAPNIVDDILEVAKTMVKNDGISVLLVEQDITKALAAADRGYVIENGRVALEGTPPSSRQTSTSRRRTSASDSETGSPAGASSRGTAGDSYKQAVFTNRIGGQL